MSKKIHPFLKSFVISTVVSAVAVGIGTGFFLFASNEREIMADDVIATNDEVIWGPGFGQQHAAYKLKRTLFTKPQILVLGSSRVTQFRSVMAPKGKSFFNAALAVSSFNDALLFLGSLYPRHRPGVLLLGIDPWWFNPARKGGQESIKFSRRDLVVNAVKSALRPEVMLSVLSGKLAVGPDQLGGRRPVGYLAALNASGFRPDGSWQYGNIILDKSPLNRERRMGRRYDFAYYRGQVRDNRGRFAYVAEPGANQGKILRQIIDLNLANGVKTVLFFPPMASALFKTIQDSPDQRAYFTRVLGTVERIAGDSGTEFFDYHDLGRLGVADAHTLDGLHVDEIGTLAVLRDMISKSAVLSEIYDSGDRRRLDALLKLRDKWAGPRRLVR